VSGDVNSLLTRGLRVRYSLAADGMGRLKTDLRWVVAAALLVFTVLASPASAQFPCGNAEDRVAPYCLNTPGTAAPSPLPVPDRPPEFENRTATEEPGERTSCGDGERFGAAQWIVVYPHAPGFFVGVVMQGYDTRIIVEDVSSGRFICSDDSLDQDGTYNSEAIGVRGLEPGKAYLIQIAGRSRLTGSPARGQFVFWGGLVPDRDADDIGDADDPCPDVPGTSCSGGGGGGGGTPQPSPPGIAPGDPDPDSDGIRGTADKCPGKGTRGRDVNQDGCEDRKRQAIDVKWRIVPTSGRGIVMRELRLSDTRKGTTVKVKCSRGCRALTLKPTKSKLNVSARRMGAGRLRPGTTIEVSVARPGYNGETHRFKVTKTTMTQSWTRCLPEGKSTPVKGACY
jgi:hypothetical protein